MGASHFGLLAACFLLFVPSLVVVVESLSELESNSIQYVANSETMELPKEFDSRNKWPHCSNIGKILDQGHCSSSWAFAAVGALSDRFCVHFNMDISLSVNDVLACCGEERCGSCAAGGDLDNAWDYFVTDGVVTSECAPYFDSVGCNHPGCNISSVTPQCVRQCISENQPWEKYYAENFTIIDTDDVRVIMKELYENGPISMGFRVYEDFENYTSGVYKRTEGAAFKFGLGVKLIGWGTSADGVDYWLLANQWNTRWGEDGFFKIRRGTNECFIEAYGSVVTGFPKFPSLRNMVMQLGSSDSGHATI